MNMKALFVALALGLLGTSLLVLYMRRFEAEMSGGERIELLTVVKPIERGTKVTEEMLSRRAVPAAYVEDRAVKAVERTKVLGLETSTALSPQQTLMWTDLAITTEDRDLSTLVQPGKRGVTVRASTGADDNKGNALIRPGDYVDVIVTMNPELITDTQKAAVVLLQKVLVLAVGQKTQAIKNGESGGNEGNADRQLTLSLTLPEAQLLALALDKGRLSVAVRNARDPATQDDIPDIKASALLDTKIRADIQRPTSGAPVRIEGTAIR